MPVLEKIRNASPAMELHLLQDDLARTRRPSRGTSPGEGRSVPRRRRGSRSQARRSGGSPGSCRSAGTSPRCSSASGRSRTRGPARPRRWFGRRGRRPVDRVELRGLESVEHGTRLGRATVARRRVDGLVGPSRLGPPRAVLVTRRRAGMRRCGGRRHGRRGRRTSAARPARLPNAAFEQEARAVAAQQEVRELDDERRSGRSRRAGSASPALPREGRAGGLVRREDDGFERFDRRLDDRP